ncbi:hypothetical protein KEM55_004019 [Ascosphaera atra]|nr:hypothetical protein KEM55_004019 [Ascosphaera atra]
MDYMRPQFCVTRPDGTVSPLVPLDELPPFIEVVGCPRSTYQNDCHGMIPVGGYYHPGRHYSTTIYSPGGSYTFDSNGTLIKGNEAVWNNTSRNNSRPKKEFCSHWIRTGECDFMQQGCKFKHMMPTDPVTLGKLGLRDIPRWYRKLYNIPSLLPESEQENAPPEAPRLGWAGSTPAPMPLKPLLEEGDDHSLTPMPHFPNAFSNMRLRQSLSSSSLFPRSATSKPMDGYAYKQLPTASAGQSFPSLHRREPVPLRSANSLNLRYGDGSESAGSQDTEATNPTPSSESPVSTTGNATIKDPFASTSSMRLMWPHSETGPISNDGQLRDYLAASMSNLTVTGNTGQNGYETPLNETLRRTNSTSNNLSTIEQTSYARLGGLPSASSPNLATAYRNPILRPQPSIQTLSSKPSLFNDNLNNRYDPSNLASNVSSMQGFARTKRSAI